MNHATPSLQTRHRPAQPSLHWPVPRKFENPFGWRPIADRVIAGVDLSRKRFLVTGCNSGIGLQTMLSLAANGAEVVGLARSFAGARDACRIAGGKCIPDACDLSDLRSVAAAADEIRQSQAPIDGLIANAGTAPLPYLQVQCGVEMQFLVNYLGHFALINQLSDMVRNNTGRIVIVTDPAASTPANHDMIMFDNLDGRQFYHPQAFYRQSKSALCVYGQELSRRLSRRKIAVNTVFPGVTRGRRWNRSLSWHRALLQKLAGIGRRSAPQAAATQVMVAASPLVAGISGEHWFNCEISARNPSLEDQGLAQRLWETSSRILHGNRPG
jgi:NAD(P)-dependent dehydrogenase (short-subunit alcohol dehydrogenase family)